MVIDFPDDTARVNALLGGQIDAMTDVPPAQVAVVNGHSGTKVLESPSAAWTPICMRVDAAPFTDVRVRQAMRLIANRPQMVAQALSGHGKIGNDLYAPFDEAFAKSLPQRVQDIEKAKSLLKAAGQEGLTVDLQSTNGALGMNEGAQVFAQQAKAAGVTVNVKILDSGAFYGDQYLKWPFSTDFWGSRNYLSQVAAGQPALVAVQRDALARGQEVHRALQPGSGHDRPDEAGRDHPGDAEDGVRHGRLHRLGLLHAARRLLDQGAGAEAG